MIPKSSTLIIAGRARLAAALILAVVAGWACWHSLRTARATPFTTWTVSVGNPGACTIADPNCAAIGDAVAAATPTDTINVAAGTYNEHDIVIDKDLTISGAAANTTIVDAQQLGRVFYINFVATVNISGLTIKNGLTAPVIPDLTSKNRMTAGAAGPRTINGFGIDGGGIFNQGTLNLTSCTMSDNATSAGGFIPPPQKAQKASQRFAHIVRSGSATQFPGGTGGRGGGIYNEGTLFMKSCTVSNNRTGFGGDSDTTPGDGGAGGGIYNDFQTLDVSNSTITNNRTGKGGNLLLCNPGAPLGDTATPLGEATPGNGGTGGGISNHGILRLGNSTITDNETGPGGASVPCPPVEAAKRDNGTAAPSGLFGAIGGHGGGVYSGDAQTTITAISTIIANNIVPETASGPDIYTALEVVGSQGYNLVGIADGSNGFTQPTDQTGSISSPLNPGLGLLMDNGGPTQTMALLVNSPAIDRGKVPCPVGDAKAKKSPLVCGLDFDQRGPGFSRTVDLPVANAAGGDGTDIGAFEVQTPFPCAPDVTPPVIVCPGSITKFTDPGQLNAIVNPGTAVATDDCALQSIIGVRSDGRPLNAPYPVGVTLITWTATDASGNRSSCTQSIAVMIPPSGRWRRRSIP